MNSEDIKTWQAKKVNEKIGPTLGYLTRLKARLDKRGFKSSDPFYQIVAKAQDALQHLVTETHYLSCKSGVGRPARE
jgi:hypothetical protein